MVDILQGDGAQAVSIINTTDENFQKDVLEKSLECPVLVDFWADWCAPCKNLTPLLEKVVRDYGGKVVLVKVDTDANPLVAQQFGVQSLPTVFGVVKGQPVDAFQGSVPESQIKSFIDKLLQMSGQTDTGSQIDKALEQALSLRESKAYDEAIKLYQDILQYDSTSDKGYEGLVDTFILAGKFDEAEQALKTMPQQVAKTLDVEALKNKLAHALEAHAAAGQLDTLMARAKAEPSNAQAQYDVAVALFGAGRVEDAFDALFSILEKDIGWNEKQAHKQVLNMFESIGPADPLVQKTRRRLSRLFFA